MSLVPCKECGKPISSKVQTCPQCGAAQPTSLLVKLGLSVLGTVALICIGSLAVHNRHSNDADLISENEHFEDRETDDGKARAAMRAQSEKYVNDGLKSPSTATFAPADEWEITVVDKDTVKLRAWVDSQNSFAAIIRDYFTVAFSIDKDTTTLVYLKFDSQHRALFGKEPLSVKQKADRDARDKATQEEARAHAARDAEAALQRQTAAARYHEEAEKLRTQLKEEDEKITAQREADYHRQQKEIADAKAAAEQAAEDARYHIWTTADGASTFEAKIKSYSNGVVTMVGRDGNQKKVNRTSLSDLDQTAIDDWIKAAKPTINHSLPKTSSKR